MKCYRTRLEALVKDNPRIGGRGRLTKAMIVRIATGARSAIIYHSKTGDVAALRHDLRNGPRHCFGDHSNCRPDGFCRHVTQDQAIRLHLHHSLPLQMLLLHLHHSLPLQMLLLHLHHSLPLQMLLLRLHQ